MSPVPPPMSPIVPPDLKPRLKALSIIGFLVEVVCLVAILITSLFS